jgi:maltose O-acetyltransferase
MISWLDGLLYRWIMRNAPRLPLRVKKLVAWYYPDARARKRCWQELNVTMGEGTYANPGLLVVNTMEPDTHVSIGRNVSIAPGVILVADSAPTNSDALLNHPEVQRRLIQKGPIAIEDEVWIGAGAIILPGVRVGQGSIIGAAALVISDVPPWSVVAGIPAKVTRTIGHPGTGLEGK